LALAPAARWAAMPSRRHYGAALICKPKFIGITFCRAIPHRRKRLFEKFERLAMSPRKRLPGNAFAQSQFFAR
jgi:hypothetical protein